MGDTDERRRLRDQLSKRLQSYYETLMKAARHDNREKRWMNLVKSEPAEDARPL